MAKPARAISQTAATCLHGMLDLLLPDVCGACGAERVAADGLCEACNRQLLSLVALSACPRCGQTLGPNIPARENGCGACPETLPRFERVYRLGPYTGPLRLAVRGLKYHRLLRLRGRLSRLLAERILADGPDCALDAVVPVPMHWRRRLSRGFDHARSIAAGVARELGVPLGGEIVRVRNTPPQIHLPRTKRIENVHGAFDVRSPATVRGAAVLLVDDVTTTGATANEAARTLLRAGARRVRLAVLAKSEPPIAYAHAFA
ncbi:MAG TPA: ComF family protein [Phycisphaerae bacterium]|nr:ComF family protein [Phycisphaerae bacterium]